MQIDGLVSTIIPVFNRPAMVREAIASVLAQDYRPIEIVVVDDGSTDDTPEAVEALQSSHPEIRLVRRPKSGGPGAARESGRLAARGSYIQYLDSDDLLLPGKFTAQVRGLAAHPECGVAYGKTRHYWIGDQPKDIAWKRTGESIPAMFPAFLQSRWWATSTPLFRREVVDRAGPWLPLINEEDWEYDCRIAAFGTRLHYTAEFVSDQRAHSIDPLSANGGKDPGKLMSRAIAHERIFGHAATAGISPETPEMRHFSRGLFLLARQCGAAGLSEQAATLFGLAREASTETRARGLDFRIYRAAAGIIGWRGAAHVAGRLDLLRR
jgi:glycosyltransferase involved in cell wall biosynthesis